MKRFLAFILFVLMVLGCAACQPTPTEPIVVSKGDGALQKTVYGTPAPQLTEPYSAPDTWDEEIDGIVDNKLVIIMNATVDVPDVLAYPIYRVTLHDYTNDDVKTFIKNTAGDADLYTAEGKTVPDLYGTYTYAYQSEAECQAIVDGADYQLNDENSPFNLYLGDCSDNEMERIVKSITDCRTAYLYMLEHQDEFLIKTDVDYEKQPDDGRYVSYLSYDGKYKLWFHLTRSKSLIMGCEFNAPTSSILKHNNETSTKHSELNGVKLSADEAEIIAEKYIKSLGLNDWSRQNTGSFTVRSVYDQTSFMSIYSSGLSGVLKNDSHKDVDYYRKFRDGRSEMYNITFTPTLSGVPVLFTSNAETCEYAGNSFIMPSISVGVDDSGIRLVQYENTKTSFECVNDNVTLLPFDKIQDIFRRYIVMKTDFSDKYYSAGRTELGKPEFFGQRDLTGFDMTTLNIDSVKLGYIKIREINESTFLAVPAWCFYGTEINRFVKSQAGQLILNENSEVASDTQAGHVFLCINAIDGSIIDLSQGY